MAVYGDDRTDAAIRTASVLVASSWSASSTSAVSIASISAALGVGRPDPGEPTGETPGVRHRRFTSGRPDPARAGLHDQRVRRDAEQPSRRVRGVVVRMEAGEHRRGDDQPERSVWRPSCRAERRPQPTSAASGGAQCGGDRGQLAGEQQFGDVFEVVIALQVGERKSAELHAVVGQPRDRRRDLHVDRRSRVRVGTSAGGTQRVDLVDGEERRAAVGSAQPRDPAAADVGVQRRRRHAEQTGCFGRTNVRGHPPIVVRHLIQINVDSINVDSSRDRHETRPHDDADDRCAGRTERRGGRGDRDRCGERRRGLLPLRGTRRDDAGTTAHRSRTCGSSSAMGGSRRRPRRRRSVRRWLGLRFVPEALLPLVRDGGADVGHAAVEAARRAVGRRCGPRSRSGDRHRRGRPAAIRRCGWRR